MIAFFILLVIGFVAFSMAREGLFTAFCYLFGVVFAGLVSFNFWPLIANSLEDAFKDSFLANCEDAIALLGVFSAVMAAFRLLSNTIANRELDIPPQISQVAGGAVGAITGFFVAGFLLCALQTLPWQENFLGYKTPPTDNRWDAPHKIASTPWPDQIWLKMMRHASSTSFEEDEDHRDKEKVFNGFTHNFAKYRRLNADGKALDFPKQPPPPPPAPKVEPKKVDPENPPPVEGKENPPVLVPETVPPAEPKVDDPPKDMNQ